MCFFLQPGVVFLPGLGTSFNVCATVVVVGVYGGDSAGVCASPRGCFGATKCHDVVAGRDFAERC